MFRSEGVNLPPPPQKKKLEEFCELKIGVGIGGLGWGGRGGCGVRPVAMYVPQCYIR